MKKTRSFLPATEFAVQALGAQIAAGRRELGWTTADLAGRLGIQRQLVGQIERGSASTALGIVLEAAVLCGVPLFGVDAARLGDVADRQKARLALLPTRVRFTDVAISNDF